ncbi:hypothetical protein DO021_18085 [Desulfobacter hydrogenophilus]|uniref:Uncharacterized protein n=1 Tax=Desulfobacter hydrogenophilus TaxID=2291 RepID=A0A328FB24_9BACT|nr:hypothetical protein [Desulfobacter hydrogenophilus]NDY73306.1 hypothetical protein [Desulfobacter hydrogenophilus]QBH15289.1 hypothetical protein EYB58_21665 [Desulfobacter hydrogenophilus]RAM00632.1 hypothetical protein DO021_18085 [Desulfobacter hydrogenophilus]
MKYVLIVTTKKTDEKANHMGGFILIMGLRPFVFLENFITIEIFVNDLIAKKLNLNRGDVHKMVSQLREGVVKKPQIILQGEDEI